MTSTLEDLNQISELVLLRHRILSSSILATFDVGSAIQFDAKTRGIIKETDIKKNTKTVVVKCNNIGMIWKVSSGLLKSVQD